MRVSPDPVFRVTSIRRETPSSRAVRVALDATRFEFRAGQSALIGPADRTERVPYSLACSPDESRDGGFLEFLIKVEPSGRWGHIFGELRRGQWLAVRGPYGRFTLPGRLDDRPILFIAGGTGIAPIRAMMHEALGADGSRRLKLLFSARTPSDFAYLRELRRMVREHALELRLHVTREASPRWRGHRGRVARTHLASLVDDPGLLCFVCGPAAMVAEVPRMLAEMGVAPERVTVEEW